MIGLSIDVTLLQKARFKEVIRKNGKKAIFAELVLFESPNSEYGDYIVKQQVTKEERAAKLEMPILGNGKILERRGGQPPQAQKGSATPAGDGPPETDDVPF